jgi:signal transduction histidine kinase
VAEIGLYWRSVAEVAAFEERRKLARDLHDGLAKELARIRTNLSWLDEDDRFVQRARAGADRALLESRRAIATLGDHLDGSADDVLADVARDVGEREGTRVALTLDHAVDLSPAQREALVMITSEAITNAARHGGAEVVRVELHGEPLRLTVRDQGRGFDPAARDGAGFGLTSMRQRAEAIGARLVVSSEPQSGTQVEVRL